MAKRPGAGGIILLAVVLGLVTAYLIYSTIRDLKKSQEQNWKPVVVARVDIEARQKITEDKIDMMPVAPKLLVPGVLTNKEDAVGRLARSRIGAMNQLRASDVVREDEVTGISYKIPPGHRAIAIAVDEVKGVGTTIQPDDHVDILTTYSDPVLRQEVTKIILQNISVLAVDRGRTEAAGGQGGATTSITLALLPEDTELVKAAERAGVLQVALRPVQDQAQVASPGVRISDILPGMRTIEPAATGTNTAPVMMTPPTRTTRPEIKIYRGNTETVVSSGAQ